MRCSDVSANRFLGPTALRRGVVALSALAFGLICCVESAAGESAVATPDATATVAVPDDPAVDVDDAPGTGTAADPEVAKWEDDIAALVALDQTESADGAILFIGSSSIRLWTDIAEDMAPWTVVRRGYGGAALLDVRHYVVRLIRSHDPRAVVLFVGNDIKGGQRDRTPEQVLALFDDVCEIIRRDDPERLIFYIGVTPTPERFDAWPQIDAANTLIAERCAEKPNTEFIATDDIYIRDGQVRRELFGDDNLHQNRTGYGLWSDRIKTRLLETLGTP